MCGLAKSHPINRMARSIFPYVAMRNRPNVWLLFTACFEIACASAIGSKASLSTRPCQVQAPPVSGVSEPWILAATILGSSMAFIDGTVVNVALPALQKSLNATVLDVQWVVESYALFLAALLLAGGSMGDRYGRRRIFCAGVALFGLASFGCGLAQSVSQLIVARAAQGVAGALLVPGSLAIISASFDEERRGRAIGTWSGFTAITAGAGPVLGGWLIEQVSWRAVFFINIPIALIVLLVAFLHVPESRDDDANAALGLAGSCARDLGLGYACLWPHRIVKFWL